MTRPLEERSTDVVVVGSGVAGLSVALRLVADAPRRPLEVTVLSKTGLGDGSSRWAQGGIACALGVDDSPAQHAADTLGVSGGLGDAEVVRILTREAPERIVRLIERGARFDRGADGFLELGLEGGHAQNRILHAGGDATGAEVMKTLVREALSETGVKTVERVRARELVVDDGRVVGVLAATEDGRRLLYRARAVVLATGGFGAAYLKTTNPPEVTGDAVAMAARAGATVADMEFVQFHPTALDVGAEPMPLLTEALRGAGARLIDDAGERFMTDVSSQAELAPRDLVARTLWQKLARGERVWLDARPALARRDFPTAVTACRRYGLDLRREPVPVSPAAHYTMGGIAVDARGRSSLAGLWVCGEAGASGLHGANRLASNSLLEGLVFGARIADDVRDELEHLGVRPVKEDPPLAGLTWETPPDAALERAIRTLLWEQVGVVRTEVGLQSAARELNEIARSCPPGSPTLDLASVGLLVTTAALARRESRGAHFRRDFPQRGLAWDRRIFLRSDARGRVAEVVPDPFAESRAQFAGTTS